MCFILEKNKVCLCRRDVTAFGWQHLLLCRRFSPDLMDILFILKTSSSDAKHKTRTVNISVQRITYDYNRFRCRIWTMQRVFVFTLAQILRGQCAFLFQNVNLIHLQSKWVHWIESIRSLETDFSVGCLAAEHFIYFVSDCLG